MILKKNEGLMQNIVMIFKGLFFSEYHLFLIYAFYSNLALAVYFYIQYNKLVSYICLLVGILEYILCVYYDDRYRTLQKKHSLLSNCYDSLPSLFLILDKNWNVVFANDIFQAFSIGKPLTTFDNVLDCFSENKELCDVLKKGMSSMNDQMCFSENIQIDKLKAWKIYIGIMKQSNKNFYVCYISDIEEKEEQKENNLENILDSLSDGIVTYNNKKIAYLNQPLTTFLKYYNVSEESFYDSLMENHDKKTFYLSYKTDRETGIAKLEKTKVFKKEQEYFTTYKVIINENILHSLGDLDNRGIVLLDDKYNIIESNNIFNSFVNSYFVKKTNVFQYVDLQAQGILRQYLKDKSNGKEIQPISVNFGDKNGNLVKIQGNNLNNIGWVLYIQDNNVQKDLEKQLVHSQRLGLLGQVLSGVSHDFNNILTAISGFCDFLCAKVSLMDDRYFALIQIKHNINRAINLVKYILYLSKDNVNTGLPENETNVNDTVTHLLNNMGRLLGENITINFVRSETNMSISMFPINLEQILLNLVVNARDAMKNGGVITITTNFIKDINLIDTQGETLEPGEYLEISVSDTGEGISEQNKKKIFDSFFTTKKEGTGLGLSMIQSIVKQNKGIIRVTSKLNVGTTFKIYLAAKIYKKDIKFPLNPLKDNILSSLSKETENEKKKIMNLVFLEDDLSLNQLFENHFKQKEYLNLVAYTSAQEVLNHIKKMIETGKALDVLIADVIIKDGNSLEVLDTISQISPKTKLVLMSGHNLEYLESLENYSVLQKRKNDIVFLYKPFSLDMMTSVIDKIYREI